MSKYKIKMVITDLDGTLLNQDSELSTKNYKCLQLLGEKKIIRVIATGRSIFSLNKVINKKIPIDFMIFSSGAGIIKWDTNKIILKKQINSLETEKIINFLINYKCDFMLHEPIPNNHKFLYYSNTKNNVDFKKRLNLYKKFAKPLSLNPKNYNHSTQIIIISEENVDMFNYLHSSLSSFKVIRTTSPLDGKSMWIEIFPQKVSKGHSVEWLCKRLNISQNYTLSLGNDFNDLDLLNWTKYSYVVENAHNDLKKQFKIVRSNEHSGFSHLIYQIVNNQIKS